MGIRFKLFLCIVISIICFYASQCKAECFVVNSAKNIGQNYFNSIGHNTSTNDNTDKNKYKFDKVDSTYCVNYELENYIPKTGFGKRLDKYTESPLFRLLSVPVPMMAYAWILKDTDINFRSIRNDYTPKFKYEYDDYLQYAPAGLMLGLKAFGVEGRSSWGRMLVSDAFSAGLMALSVNTLKYSVKRNRPDDSKRNSFPSGHTATAFMTATMLHKEYGMTRSYWYSVAGYSMATVTGISRQLNNKHWVSDVVFGAALGILTTELGYMLADLIFKDKGLIRPEKSYVGYDKNSSPSFFGLYLGNTFMLNKTKMYKELGMDIEHGCTAGLEGALFKNKNFGFGGRLTFMTTRLLKDKEIIDESLDVYALQVGPYFSLPISKYWLFGANILGGLANTPFYNAEYKEEGRGSAWLVGSGISISFMPNKNLSFRCITDYNHILPFGGIQLINKNYLSLGGGVGFVF